MKLNLLAIITLATIAVFSGLGTSSTAEANRAGEISLTGAQWACVDSFRSGGDIYVSDVIYCLSNY